MSKYIIIKVSDVVAATHIDEQRSLHGILQKIHQFRLAAGKDANTMVAMNMTDPFARVAVSAYINAIESGTPGHRHRVQKRSFPDQVDQIRTSSRRLTQASST